MKPKTEDEKFRSEYIRLIINHVKNYKFTNHGSLLSPEDKRVIEYHLKDVARHAVLENTSTEECIAIFNGRIERLIKGDKQEWENVLELARRHRNFITQMDIVLMDDLFRHFIKKRVSVK